MFLVNQTTPFIEICSIENWFLIYFVVVVLDGPVFMLASHISLIGLKRTLANNEVQKLIHWLFLTDSMKAQCHQYTLQFATVLCESAKQFNKWQIKYNDKMLWIIFLSVVKPLHHAYFIWTLINLILLFSCSLVYDTLKTKNWLFIKQQPHQATMTRTNVRFHI